MIQNCDTKLGGVQNEEGKNRGWEAAGVWLSCILSVDPVVYLSGIPVLSSAGHAEHVFLRDFDCIIGCDAGPGCCDVGVRRAAGDERGQEGEEKTSMIQYVIASHGRFASEGLHAASMLFGEIPDNFHVLSVLDGGDGIAAFEKEAAGLAAKLKQEPVLIMSDFFGGSPFMTLLSAFRDNDYKLVSGFNLPMIVEALSQNQSDLTLKEIADRLIDNGKNLSIRLVDKIQTDETELDEIGLDKTQM